MKVAMSVTLDRDGVEAVTEATADARDIRAYEAEFKASFLTTELSMTQLTQLAYVTMRRLQVFAGGWDAFDAQCVGVDSVEGEPADPTLPAPMAGS